MASVYEGVVEIAKDYYIRTMRAGRYCKAVRYKRPIPGDTPVARSAKNTATNKAQQYINRKSSAEKLQMLMCANFDHKDACFCTMTFDQKHLPPNRRQAQSTIKNFIRRLRNDWKQAGRELKYIYTVEGEPISMHPEAVDVDEIPWEIAPWKETNRWEKLDNQQDDSKTDKAVRFHVHCILLLQKDDFQNIRSRWKSGNIHINPIKVNDITTFPRLSAYMTKESRAGDLPTGARGYVPSINLEQPVLEGHWCSECETIAPPRDAEVIHSGREDTFYSSYQYCFYRVPRPQQIAAPYKRKASASRKKTKK